MSICYNVRGDIVLKKETTKEVETSFHVIIKKYDDNCKFQIKEEFNLLSFNLYAKHSIIDRMIDYLENNKDKLIEGQIWLSCQDEDSFDEEGFPFIIFIEIYNGQIYVQSLKRKLPCDWNMRYNNEDSYD